MSNTTRVLPVAILVAAICGCSDGVKTAQPIPAASVDPAPAHVPQASPLADLARRDVQAFLNQRNQSSEQQQAAPTQTSPPQIVWNQSGNTAQPTEPQITQPDQPIQQSPLFIAEEPAQVHTPQEIEAADALERDRVRELVVELSKELYRDAAHADMPLRELFLIAATTLVSPDRALNAEAIPGLTPREREILREFQTFFTSLGETLDGAADAEQAITSAIEQLRAGLRTEPQLNLGTVALCTRVGGFGDFDQFDKYAFLAHSQQQAIVYIEIENFTSELNQRNEWVTELSQQLTIYSDRDGIPVWREDWQSATDRTRNKRTDFFVVQLITLPQPLSVGRYHLKVRVRDERSGAEAEASVPFEMVADPKMAASVR